MIHLIAYDIADPDRLRRVARFLERHALRCQKSVFLHRGGHAAVIRLLDELGPLLRPDEDCVQAWKLAADEPMTGLTRGRAIVPDPACVVAGPSPIRLVQGDKP